MARWNLSLIRGRGRPPILAGLPNPAAARFVDERHVQAVHGQVGFVDGPEELTVLVEGQVFQSPPASVQEGKHRADSILEGFGLLGR
jgi:hypothetical protein